MSAALSGASVDVALNGSGSATVYDLNDPGGKAPLPAEPDVFPWAEPLHATRVQVSSGVYTAAGLSFAIIELAASADPAAAGAALPPSPPCPVAAPPGFALASQQGWWIDPTCANMSCAKPNIDHRHGVSVECCAEYCAADPECQGFEVYEPCGISDCYAYHHVDKSTFVAHPGAFSFSWSGARTPVHNVSSKCTPVNKLCDHPVVLDAEQKIMPWSSTNTSTGLGPGAYEYTARLAYSWFHNVPLQDGYPLWYFFGSFEVNTGKGSTWPSTPASMAQYTASATTMWLAFTGDIGFIHSEAVPLSKYILANGTTPPTYLWGSMPFASARGGAETFGGVNNGPCTRQPDGTYKGCSGDGVGNIEPDKAADAGLGFNQLANVTGDASLRLAAVAVADTLAKLVRPAPLSNGTHSPWPFRVGALSGEVIEQYTSNVYSHLRLFDQLIGCTLIDLAGPVKIIQANGSEFSLPRDAAYRRAHAIALEWMIKWPQKTGAWTACCEDVGVDTRLDNYNAVEPMYALFYLVEQRVKGWEDMGEDLLQFVAKNLIFNNISNEPAIQYGARCVSEQKDDHNKMGCHTARYARAVSMYNEARYGGKNTTLTDWAFRAWNWASYMVLDNGLAVVGPAASNNLWFRIQTAVVMDMIHAIRYMHHWAPTADHLFDYSCVPTVVHFAPATDSAKLRIAYNVSCAKGTETLKVTFEPAVVTAGGKPLTKRNPATELKPLVDWYEYDAATGLLVIDHATQSDIAITAA